MTEINNIANYVEISAFVQHRTAGTSFSTKYYAKLKIFNNIILIEGADGIYLSFIIGRESPLQLIKRFKLNDDSTIIILSNINSTIRIYTDREDTSRIIFNELTYLFQNKVEQKNGHSVIRRKVSKPENDSMSEKDSIKKSVHSIRGHVKTQNLGVIHDQLSQKEKLHSFCIPTPKMNIVIMVVGTQGDIQPFLYLGKTLKMLGHRVRLATHDVYRYHIVKITV